MSVELKQAAQQAVDAFEAFGDADYFASLFELTQKMRALRTAIQQAEAQQPATGEPVAWLDEMLADTREVFDANGSETPQVVRDVIEYVASWVTVYREKNHPAPSVPADVARDAERYRWLRASTFPKADQYPYRISTKPIRLPIGFDDQSTFDAAIDAAMLAAK